LHATRETRRDWVLRLARRFDGIVVMPPNSRLLGSLAATGVRCVSISACPGSLPVVRADEAMSGRLGAEYLTERGFKRFAFYGSSTGAGSALREEGFCSTIRRAGFDCLTHHREMTANWGRLLASATRWVASLPRPLAVMASNDSLGHQVLGACESLGIRVPEEIAVLGCGDDPSICMLANPPLSSIAEDSFRLGHQVAVLLDHLMSGGKPPTAPVLIPPLHVVTRQSTDAWAVGDPEIAKTLRFIHEHACDPIGVKDIVAAVAISRRRLERSFRQSIGRTPHEQIRRVQLEHAKRLLAETRKPVYQVARDVGLGSVSGISRVFRKEMGISPIQYRQRFKTR
jgi:LacI family transcriptional regulator